MLENPYDH
jgi:hypothetical protein